MLRLRFESEQRSLDQVRARQILQHLDAYSSPGCEQLVRNVIGIDPTRSDEFRLAVQRVLDGEGTINELRVEFCEDAGIDGSTMLHWPAVWHSDSKAA
jgi:hypothetical protein